jgi:hypothetical protein
VRNAFAIRLPHAAVGAVLSLTVCLCFASGGGAATRAVPELNVIYTSVPSLQVKLEGDVIRSGGSIPAGSYMVLVYDDGDYTTPRFTMNGPGVSVNSDLNSTGMGIDAPSFFGPFTLQPSSTYRIQDSNIGASSLVTITTTAASSGSSGSSGGSTGGSSGSSGSSSGGSSSGSSSGSGAKLAGTLLGAVSPTGIGSLTFGGKLAKTLKAGVYKVTIVDRSKKAAFVLGTPAKRVITLSGAAAVGTKSRNVTLTAGRWTFQATGAMGMKTAFTVK